MSAQCDVLPNKRLQKLPKVIPTPYAFYAFYALGFIFPGGVIGDPCKMYVVAAPTRMPLRLPRFATFELERDRVDTA